VTTPVAATVAAAAQADPHLLLSTQPRRPTTANNAFPFATEVER